MPDISEQFAHRKIDVQLTVSSALITGQSQIVEEVVQGLRVVSANHQRATRLRQSILQKAFTGSLNQTNFDVSRGDGQ